MISRSTLALCATLSLTLAPSASLRAQSGVCKEIANALLRNGTTPYHAYRTQVTGYKGKPDQSEIVSAGGVLYLQVHGRWMRSRSSAKDVADSQRQDLAALEKNYVCTRLGTESVNGTSAQRYHIDGKSEDGDVIKEEVWLANGMVQRLDQDMNVGGGPAGNSRSSMRFVYTNVQAPPGVR